MPMSPQQSIAISTPSFRREIRLFIASPSDCGRERQLIIDLAHELNEVFCISFQVALVPIGWENVAPALGEPQLVIDEAIGDYDILIGVMWLRFGTPTSSGAQSGTEHEFNNAYELWKATGKPQIMFYFNDHPPESLTNFDLEQYQKVRVFKEKLQKLALTKNYQGFSEFEKLVRLDLQKVIRDIGIKTVKAINASEPIPKRKRTHKTEALPPLFFHSCPLPHSFIHRKEIADLVDILKSKGKEETAPSVISIVGIAGSGKTVSVRAALDELLRKHAKLDGIFWYSFYEAKAQSSEEFLFEALTYLSQGELDFSKSQSPHQRKVLLWKYLQTGKYLLILDGLEYLQLYAPSAKAHGQLQDRVMRDFLRGACQLKMSAIIVTSRLFLTDLYGFRGYLNMPLTSFKKEEAWKYMLESGVKGSHEVIDDACAAFGYHPLSLRVLTDYLVRFYHGDAEAAQRFKSLPTSSPVAEKLDVLFGSYWSMLNEDQQFFLSRLSALRTGATENDFSVLVRPLEMGGSGDPHDPNFRESVARLEHSALLEVHERTGEKFYTAPALLRMLAYDRMSTEERKKAHLEWLRYTEGIPIPSYAQNIERLAPVIEMIYHCLKAGLYSRAWELYNRKGKYNLSRQLIDWGSHEVAIEIDSEFWRLKDSVATSVNNEADFINELIGFYSTHLALSGRIATAKGVIAKAPINEFEMPLCIRTRYFLLAGDYLSASRMHQNSLSYPHSQYSLDWSEALLQFYGSDNRNCLENFKEAIKNGFMLIRGYLGFLYFDYISALIAFNEIEEAELQIKLMEANVVRDGAASGFEPYLSFLTAQVNSAHRELAKADKQYQQALEQSKEFGDTFLECLVLIGKAQLEEIKYRQSPNVEFIDTAAKLCHQSLHLCREAGEGELDYGFVVPAGQANALLVRSSLQMRDKAAAMKHFDELGSICKSSQHHRLTLEHERLKAVLPSVGL
jgi:NB-ARC domain-containing protein